jgi:Zn finger protein HypA/HybF involved in hydrogenase expression
MKKFKCPNCEREIESGWGMLLCAKCGNYMKEIKEEKKDDDTNSR